MKHLVLSLSVLLNMFFVTNVFSEPTWSYGNINVTELYPDKIVIRWDGPNTQDCSQNHVSFTVQSLDFDDVLFERAYKMVLLAQTSGQKVRFKLDGCDADNKLQNAYRVQICSNENCSF